MKPKSTDRRNSRYIQGGTTDLFNNRIGFWQRNKFPKHETDISFTIDSKSDRRPWIVAHNFFGDVELMWFVLQYNTILDVDTEFVAGKIISLPTPSRLFMDLLSSNASSINKK
jgi:hypothetical protein